MRNVIVSMLAAVFLGLAAYAGAADSPPPVEESATPDGKLTLKGGSVAAGIGYTWGHGDLEYRNGTHRFTIRGVSVVDVGATEFTATGHVYNLKQLSDFSGNYVAAAAGVTIAGGATATYLKNEHGVVIKLLATDVGLKFNLSADGVHIALKK
ncbi:MAG: EipA family protein [Steroidobacteraceae bacterium]